MNSSTAISIVIVTAIISVAVTVVVIGHTGREVVGDVRATVHDVTATVKPVADGLGNIEVAIADRISRTKELENTIFSLRDEIATLRAQRVSPNALKPFFELGFDIPYEGYNVKPITLTSVDSGVLTRKEVVEYLGVYSVNFTRKIGVEVKDLKFELRPNNRIAIAGLKPKLLGVRNVETRKLVCEVRRHLTEGKLPDQSTILNPGDKDFVLVEQQRSRQEVSIQQWINSSGMDFSGLPFEELVFPFLTICFGEKYQLKMDDKLSDPKNFVEICDLINAGFDKAIANKEEEIQHHHELLDREFENIKKSDTRETPQ
jgi:hypothetical protein